MITVKFSCDGCFAEAKGTSYLRTKTKRINDLFVSRKTDTVEDVCPEGWVAFDPYTKCTYCPTCWDEIESPQEKQA